MPGEDTDEFFELAGPPGFDLTGLTYLVLGDDSGGSGSIESVTDLDGVAIPTSGYLLVAKKSTFILATPDLISNFNFENSDNVHHFLVKDFTGANGDDLDTDDDGVLNVEPWDAVIDSVALVESFSTGEKIYTDTTVGPDGTFVPGHAFYCEELGGWQIGTFEIGNETPGSDNSCDSDVDDVEEVLINQVQGSGTESPLIGKTVSITGIVTSADSDLKGFFVQSLPQDDDGDEMTSEGIFVFVGTVPSVSVSRGDIVEVTGKVEESFSSTQISEDSTVLISSGNVLPDPVVINLLEGSFGVIEGDSLEFEIDLERFENMYVTFAGELMITEQFNLDRFNEVKLVAVDEIIGRPITFTQNNQKDTVGFREHLQNLAARRITYDDGSNTQNRGVSLLDGFNPDGNGYREEVARRMGDKVQGLTGVLTYTFGAFRVISSFQGENQNAFVASTNRPDVPSLSGSRTFATFNVLNFFTTFGSRGAENAEEFDRQLKKLVNAIIQSDADIYGLIEIENDFSSNGSPIQTLVTAINDKLGIDEFTYVQPPTDRVGSDAIAVALIYKKSTIREFPGATPAVLDFEDMKTRAALAQSFQAANDDDDNSPCFTVSVNHFKSKGSDCDDLDDRNLDDGQGNCNLTRLNAAEKLVAWLATSPTGQVCDNRRMIVGDLNSYRQEDPIAFLETNNYRNVINDVKTHSYVFDGQTGTLDYIMVNTEMAVELVADGGIWSGANSDEADALDYQTRFGRDTSYYNGETPWRASDHDMVIVGLNL